MWTHRENHGHRNIKGGKHVDYFVEEQVVTEEVKIFNVNNTVDSTR